MAEPINLNKFRKQKARADKDQQAQENRIKFGRTKAAKSRDKAEADKASKTIDGARRDD
ncbi:MAG: DUF4169 family protein [Pseudomonadota bacterium]